jgi:hypothetical protein
MHDHPILPLVFRKEEEEAMRACRPGERACLRGPACYGQCLPQGHQLPRFRYWVGVHEASLTGRISASFACELTRWLRGSMVWVS